MKMISGHSLRMLLGAAALAAMTTGAAEAKNLIGTGIAGSDDHAGVDVGRTFT